MSRADKSSELPPLTRALLAQRPNQSSLPEQGEPARGPERGRWRGLWVIVVAFTHQVLLRPVRLGILVSLGGMIAVVAADAARWWILLGVVLFQAAASALTLLWVDLHPGEAPCGTAKGCDTGHPDAGPRSEEATWPPFCPLAFHLPNPRRPGPGE